VGSIDPTLDLSEEIRRLKGQKRAVLLAHYYQEEEIQELADFVGDSLDLSRKAQQVDADIIAFAGVRFMAETAKILNPSRKVVVPDYEAGCSLENSCPPEAFAAWRERHPGAVSLTYINCSAAVKALSDIIVTSSNAEKIVQSIPLDKEILFAPDKHLGAFLAKKTGRPMTLWPGTCIVHEQFSEREIVKLKARHPDAKLDAFDLELRDDRARQDVSDRDGGRNHPPDEEARARPRVHPGTSRQRLPVQRVPVHEAQHPREALPVPSRRAAGDRSARRAAVSRRETVIADVGAVLRELSR
jgi:hypothetical protein